MTSRTEASPARRKRPDGSSIEGGERMDDTVHGLALVRPDLESRLTDDHHEALRLWLRLLTCTTMVESTGRISQAIRPSESGISMMDSRDQDPSTFRNV